jgi:hypothetical protein
MQDKKGTTLFIEATRRGRWDTVELLLETDAGADTGISLWAVSVIGVYDLEWWLNQEPNVEL